jgi:hypothetical protein
MFFITWAVFVICFFSLFSLKRMNFIYSVERQLCDTFSLLHWTLNFIYVNVAEFEYSNHFCHCIWRIRSTNFLSGNLISGKSCIHINTFQPKRCADFSCLNAHLLFFLHLINTRVLGLLYIAAARKSSTSLRFHERFPRSLWQTPCHVNGTCKTANTFFVVICLHEWLALGKFICVLVYTFQRRKCGFRPELMVFNRYRISSWLM